MYKVEDFQGIDTNFECKDDATGEALKQTILTVQNFPPKTLVGIVKESVNFGNTSVSMGVASKSGLPQVIVLNVGSKGCKFQPYKKIGEGYCLAGKEVKPGKSAPNFHDIQNSNDDIKASIFGTAMKMLQDFPKSTIITVITGDLRNKYFSCEEVIDMRGSLFSRAETVFGGWTKPHSDSFFISQDHEAELELEACRTMYRGLSLPLPTCSFGIGGSTSQMAFHKFPNITAVVGMNKPHELSELPKQFALPQHVVALKSGCLLQLDKLKELLQNAEPVFVAKDEI